MDELLLKPIHRQNGLLMGLKSGTTDTAQAVTVKDGNIAVIVGALGQAHNRNIAAANITYASTTNSVTWVTGVTEVEITVPNTASVIGVLVVYGAPNDAVASAWLNDLGSASSDVAYDYVLPNSVKSRQLSGGITRIDVLPLGANTRVIIGAV